MSDERRESDTAMATSRRAWLAGVGAVGASAVLAACGPDDAGGPGTSGPPAGNGNDPVTGNGNNPPEGPSDTVVATTDEIEVGGGVVNGANRVVVTQPAAGEFRGFSAVCTHQGCIVATVSNGEIFCACHGSRFSAADGSVLVGGDGADPSSQDPLPEVAIAVEGSEIRLA